MLGNKSNGVKISGSTTLISRDTTITGNIQFAGSLDIEGTVQGNIEAKSGKDAVVRVLGKGRVEGEVRAPSIVINGMVEGDVHAGKQLQLASKATVEGNVYYTQVEMSVGAAVNGRMQHVGDKSEKAEKTEPKAEQPKAVAAKDAVAIAG
jgi:cytoskeletal protein CcmA (bactofilin family)